MFCILVALTISLVFWRWIMNSGLREPPVLSGKLPLFGHSIQMLGSNVRMFNAIRQFSMDGLDKGGVAKLYLGSRMFYVVTDPDECLTVLNNCIEKHYMYSFTKPLFSNGLVVADVATWQIHSKLLRPAFNQQVLDGFLDVFNSYAQSLVDQFATEVGKPFDHEAYIRVNNLESICATSFGIKSDEYVDLQKEYLPGLEQAFNLFQSRVLKFWLHNDLLYNFSSLKKKLDDVIVRLHKFSDKLIEEKKSEMLNQGPENKSGKFKPFMDLLLELSKDQPSMTDYHIRGETNTIITAGHETTASALTFVLTLLGSHSLVQEKAYQEINQVFGNSKRYVNKEDLSQLVYMEAIIKETLRLYPIAPLVARQLNKGVKLKNFTLKAGYGCLLSIYGAQRHSMWGPDAHDFRPERWFEKDSLPEPKYLLAFGGGRRICIGRNYAMMSMKTTLAYVLRNYKIKSDVNKMVVRMGTMIKPKEGFYISLEPRTKTDLTNTHNM